MNKRYSFVTILIVLFSLVVSPALSAQAGNSQVTWHIVDAQSNRISPALQARLNLLKQDEAITVIVQLRQEAILPPGRNVGRAEQSSRVIEALTMTAEKTQGPVKNFLDKNESMGRVKSYIPFWIFNGFSVTATPDTIQELAAHPDVLSITPDELDILPASIPQTLHNPEANITLINAPALWSMGYTGQGVVVASMDSGVNMSHTDISSRWRGGSNSWFDPYDQHPASPVDLSGHGTWTTGVMIGGDTGGSSIGVAPGAQWIAVKMFNDAGTSTATAIHQGYQWLLNPDGNPATADAPHIVNNSWSFAYPGCYLDFEPDLQALRAANILPVFAAGNGGPGANTSFSPANNPSAFAVGAINNSSSIYGLSSRGPTTCGGSTGVFPELVAPGVNIYTTDLAGFYTTASGTSLAAPHVTGALALLLSAYPNLSFSQQEDALRSSAFDLGIAGPDDVYGYGRLDLLAAFNSLAPAFTPISPSGSYTEWDHKFTWLGKPDATWYLLEVQAFTDTQVYRQWFTSTQTGCSGGVNCSITPTDLSLPNGDYKWRIMDYGAYGYGSNTPFLNFSLNAACYTMTANIIPANGGTVNAPVQTCPGGYTAGSTVQLTAAPNTGYLFKDWSGDTTGTSNPVSIIMNGDKAITANFKPALTPLSPTGTLTTWDKTFTWTGLTDATWYLIEVQTSTGIQVFRKWYTSVQSGCTGGTACSITTTEANLVNGDYKWQVMDYGAYGYGTNTAFLNFTLNAACYTLTVSINPTGSGSINAPTQNCAGGYAAGSILQLTAVPATGYTFTGWGDHASGTSNPLSLIMDGNKIITANMRGNTPIVPSDTLTAWSKTFTWTGLADATWYLLEVQSSTGTQVFRKWYTSAQTNCPDSTTCSVVASEINLTNGDYKWRVMDYGAYGYGINSAFKPFTLDLMLACHILTINLNPAGSGAANTTAQNCSGGYITGTVVQITAVPTTGYLFKDWSGGINTTNNPASITMDSDMTVTANFKNTTVLISPTGPLNNWDNTFTWAGLSNATWYLLEIYTPDGTQVFRKWYTSPQTNCSGGTACSITPPEAVSIPNGDYKWRILDYGSYGYGSWSPYTTFTLTR